MVDRVERGFELAIVGIQGEVDQDAVQVDGGQAVGDGGAGTLGDGGHGFWIPRPGARMAVRCASVTRVG